MHAAVIVNPAAGRGRASKAAEQLAAALGAQGIVCERLPIDAGDAHLAAVIVGACAVIVVGGDGSVRSVAARVRGMTTPLAVLPMGTENLAAREYGFMITPRALAVHVARGTARRVDLGAVRVEGRSEQLFLVMCSIGFDAEVVAALDARRRGPIGHYSYVGPMLRTLLRWRASRLVIRPQSARALGDPCFDGHGMAIFANAAQYALRLDPARSTACVDDGALDMVAVPMRHGAALAGWAAMLATGAKRWSAAAHARAEEFAVEIDPPAAMQLDGDPVAGGAVGRVAVVALPQALCVLETRG